MYGMVGWPGIEGPNMKNVVILELSKYDDLKSDLISLTEQRRVAEDRLIAVAKERDKFALMAAEYFCYKVVERVRAEWPLTMRVQVCEGNLRRTPISRFMSTNDSIKIVCDDLWLTVNFIVSQECDQITVFGIFDVNRVRSRPLPPSHINAKIELGSTTVPFVLESVRDVATSALEWAKTAGDKCREAMEQKGSKQGPKKKASV